MTTVFSNVHGFNLQLPYNNPNRPYPDGNGEWITITKRPNELPTAKLRTIVLYWRNNGNICDKDSSSGEEPNEWNPNNASSDSNPNYRFYNDYQQGLIENDELESYSGGGQAANGGDDVYNITQASTGAKFKITVVEGVITSIIVTDTGDNTHMVNDTITISAVDLGPPGKPAKSDLIITLTVNDINYITNGRQLGWIWGFPLFDVGRDATNWKRFNSCITGTNGDVSGNENMLVNISDKRNIIVLDWKGQSSGKGYERIKYKQDQAEIKDSFYMTLRVKSSTESLITGEDPAITSAGRGEGGHWNLWDGGTQKFTRWATLVQYEYECDLIGPKSMLDFTFNRFMFSDTFTYFGTRTDVGHPIYQGTWWAGATNKRVLAAPATSTPNFEDDININYGITNSPSAIYSISIVTGNNGDSGRHRLNITDIYNYLGRSSGGGNTNANTKVQVVDKWNDWNSHTVVNLIGGWFNRGRGDEVVERNIGYYGDDFGSGDRQTKMLFTPDTNITEGWKRFITLNTVSTDNVWDSNNDTDIYEFNNILWCSLQSPRKIPVTLYAAFTNNTFKNHRFITNFVDLSANTDNKIIGGGYGRYSNTIDMARESVNPYYSSTNSNTVDISGFDPNNDFNYLASTDIPLTLDDLNYFKVSYKLLVPPTGNEAYNITFNMGRGDLNVTTFVRHSDMSGVCDPVGNTNLTGNRETESITLRWDKNSVDVSTNDISMNSIYFTDIASGFKKIEPSFDISAGILTNANSSSNYDISFNVFQTHFFSKDGTDIDTERQELPYTVKPFNSNDSNPQFVDISYVPFNYQPYRYVNYSYTPQFLRKEDYPDAPVLIRTNGERLKFNIAKWWTRDTKKNAKIIDPSLNSNLPTIFIDISYNSGIPVFDNSYSIVKSGDLNQADQAEGINQEIISLAEQGLGYPDTIENSVESVEITTTTYPMLFYEPQSLKLGSNFIPDYWRLPDKLNTLFSVNKSTLPDGSPGDPYHYYSMWQNQIEANMVLDVLSIALKSEINSIVQREIRYLLVNSNKSSRNTSEWDAITDSGTSVNSSLGNMVFEVQGWNGLAVSEYLNKKPIIVQLSTVTSGPFGINSKAYIGNTAGGNTTGNPPATKDRGINVPYPEQTINGVFVPKDESHYVVDTFLPNTLRQGNGIGGDNLSGLESGYNGKFNITLSAWNDGGSDIQNKSYKGTSISPTPLTVLVVDLSNVIQTNASSDEMINNESNAITINWSSFYFSKLPETPLVPGDPAWNKTELGDVFWTIKRYDLASGLTSIVLNEKALSLNSNKEYTFTDINVRIYDKFTYTITGKFKWIGIQSLLAGSDIPLLNIEGFTTPACFACKFNRFQYGRFNTTSTNLKLYRPLLINTPQGQVNKFGEKVCGGGCRDPNKPTLNLFSGNTRISSSNNIYANTTNQVSKKQTYVILSKARFRPFR